MSNDVISCLFIDIKILTLHDKVFGICCGKYHKWYTVSLGWALKFGKVRKMRCQYRATWIQNMAMLSCCTAWYIRMSDFSAIIDTNYFLVTNCYILPAYIVFWWNTLFKYQTRKELLPHPEIPHNTTCKIWNRHIEFRYQLTALKRHLIAFEQECSPFEMLRFNNSLFSISGSHRIPIDPLTIQCSLYLWNVLS